MVVDAGSDSPVLYNGSANYSSKALKWSFENVSRYQGEALRPLVGQFANRFERLFDEAQGKDELEAGGTKVPSCPTDPESLF
jgi:hypothetical protein